LILEFPDGGPAIKQGLYSGMVDALSRSFAIKHLCLHWHAGSSRQNSVLTGPARVQL
jgi:hypothetical protein